MTDMNIERPLFETAYRVKWPEICAVNHRKFERDDEDAYLDYTVQIALEMWLAAKRASVGSVGAVETEAWLITHSGGKSVYRHNAIADFRSIDPAATVTELVPRNAIASQPASQEKA
jgi:hypothetical protein